MTQSIADYAKQKEAQNTISLNIVKYALMLCDALQQDYDRQYSHGSNYSWALDSSGRKYHKIFQYIDGQK